MNAIPEPALAEPPANHNVGKPIAGFLCFAVLGLVISPIQILFTLYTKFFPIFTTGIWERTLVEGDLLQRYFLAIAILVEISVNLFMAIFSMIILWFFYKKSKKSRILMILLIIISAVFNIADYYLVPSLIPGSKEDPETTSNFVRTMIGTAIWLPYFIFSKRVKATFVN